ncbi:hypothetical protein FQZ97_1158450 [compost metagenome]
MAEHAAYLVVVHHIHQAAVDTYTAVSHGPGVHILGHVNPCIDGHAAGLEASHDVAQALRINAVGCGQLVLLVGIGAGLVREILDVNVR